MSEIRLIAVAAGRDGKAYQSVPFYFAAKMDEKTKKWNTGQDLEFVETTKDGKKVWVLRDEEKAKGLSLIIDPGESYVARHQMVFRSDVPADMILLKFFKTHDNIIAKNKRAVIPGVHRFYLEDKEDDAKETVSKVKTEYEAMTRIKGMSLEEMQDFARVIGIGRVDKLTAIQVEAALMEKAKSEPIKVMEAMEDPNRKVKAFLKKLIEKNIIRLGAGKYMYNNEILGLNEQAVLDYLKNKENVNMVSEFGRLMNQGKEAPATV
jgi:hypothetical protein